MIQKYFFGKCGGYNCPQRYKTVKMGQSALSTSYDFIFKCNIDKKENPDCLNCPHGKTLDETKKIANKAICKELAKNKGGSTKRAIDIFLIGFKALLGGEEK